MKTSRNGLKPIPENEMPEWARVASQAHNRATKKKRAELRQRGLPMIIWKDGKVREVQRRLPVSKVSSVRRSSPPIARDMMTKVVTALLIVFTVAVARAGEIREFDWKTTTRLGNELIRVSKRADRGFSSPARKRAKATAIAALNGKLYDEVRYDYVILDDPDGGGFLVYALAIPKNKRDATTGGHFRVAVSADGANAKQVELLSQLIPQPKADAGNTIAAIAVSQLSADRPVETWIYTSDFYHLPIYVAVRDGSAWAIANGRIVRADEKGPKNHLEILNKKAPEVPQW